jgi:antitoxin (DNA-binding transcriptional repressor) of toxin-antitoxin stability system
MQTEKIGMREFRENLADYLESGRPLAITRHGETLGFFIPAQKRSRKAEVQAMRAAAKELDAMIATWGASEDELMQEYKEIRRPTAARRGMPSKALVLDANILIRAVWASASGASSNHTPRVFPSSFLKLRTWKRKNTWPNWW